MLYPIELGVHAPNGFGVAAESRVRKYLDRGSRLQAGGARAVPAGSGSLHQRAGGAIDVGCSTSSGLRLISFSHSP
jgi:hypothetical protein